MKTATMLKGAVGRQMIRSCTHISIPAQIKYSYCFVVSNRELEIRLQLKVILSEFK